MTLLCYAAVGVHGVLNFLFIAGGKKLGNLKLMSSCYKRIANCCLKIVGTNFTYSYPWESRSTIDPIMTKELVQYEPLSHIVKFEV